MPSSSLSRRLNSRFRPIYLAEFCHGFVLWYPIEKLFMKDVGFTDATIALMIALYSVVMLVAETPSGLLADRWSRKGVLILASIALALSGLIGGLSTNVSVYVFSSALWGLFFALYSGTYESVIYDTLLEEGDGGAGYERYFGRLQAYDGAALVSGSLIGGLIASTLGLRWAYFLSIPVSILAIVALWRFKEPLLHKAGAFKPIMQQVKETFRAVVGRAQLIPVLIMLVAASSMSYMVYEFSGLWVIALAAPLVLFGPINALMLSTIGLGGLATSYFKLRRHPVMLVALACLVVGTVTMVFWHNLLAAVVAIFIVCMCLTSMRIVFSRLLHDALSSRVRAGAASAVSTLGRVIIIPLTILFAWLSDHYDVFAGGWIFLGLVVVIVVSTLMTYGKRKVLPEFRAAEAGTQVADPRA